MDTRDERRGTLEEVVRLLESVRNTSTDFDDARTDGYIVTALSAARSALGTMRGALSRSDDDDTPL